MKPNNILIFTACCDHYPDYFIHHARQGTCIRLACEQGRARQPVDAIPDGEPVTLKTDERATVLKSFLADTYPSPAQIREQVSIVSLIITTRY